MRIPREDEGGDQVINISSLLDVMFILLIFFMATTTFKEEERDEQVNLPKTTQSTSLTAAGSKLIVINVRSKSRAPDSPLYLVSNRGMTVAKLRGMVEEAVKANRDQKVLVRGDEKALHGDVAQAIAACRQAGISKVNIGYDLMSVK